MHRNDIAAVRAALGLDDLAYTDLAVQRELNLAQARWPFLTGSFAPRISHGRGARAGGASRPRPSRLTVQGLRGGCGVTALVAALGHALQRLGQRVLMVDMSPENLLGQYCNLPTEEPGGWARSAFDRQPWTESAWRVLPGLHIMPYGRLREVEQERLELFLRGTPHFWSKRLTGLARQFDWVIFDLPQRLPGHAHIDECDLRLRVLNADPACLLLLQQRDIGDEWLLVNRFDPTRSLQRDLMLLWQSTLEACLIPQYVHDDEAVREALAHKAPLGVHAPHSLAAEDVLSLATWCLTRGVRHERQAPAMAGA